MRPLPCNTGPLLATAFVLACTPAGEPNAPPTATITAPATGSHFSGGESIAYAGVGSDPEDGALPGADFTWWVDLHHDAHSHPFMPPTSGAMSGSFLVPSRGHNEDNIFLRIYLRVLDADGVADTTYVDVQPRAVRLSFASAPSGVQVTVDGQPSAAPFSVDFVVGMEVDLGAPSPQVIGPDSLEWVSWSDGGSSQHTIVAPAASTSYTATYQVVATVNQRPTVSVTAPPAGTTIVQGTATPVTAVAGDPDGSVVAVEFFDGAALLGTDNSSPYSVSWSPTVTGSHSVTARATDNDGAQTTSASVNVNVVPPGGDGIPPAVQLTAPSDGSLNLSGTVNLTATASDNVGVVGVAFEVDGVAISEDLTAPYAATIPATTAYTTGVHVLRAQARDAAGNRSTWSASRVTFNGAELPAGFSRAAFVTGLNGRSTTMAFAPDGRLFIAEQTGALRVVKGGALLATPFVTVPTAADGERGLLGVTFHPQFATNGWVYVYYTSSVGGAHNRISRFTAAGDVAVGGETVVVDLPNLSSAIIHNGGALHFGPDGKLYVAVGDNNSEDSQLLTSPFGKILRFNDDGTIPADNPFHGSTTGINRSIWALGLRNPFTFAFQPVTGRMFINDVGQAAWEEIDEGQPGANYGWPLFEGFGGAPTYSDPVFAYGHTNNPSLVVGAAIVGAAFYGPASALFPAEYQGNFFFGDYESQEVHRLDTVNGNAVYAFWVWNRVLTDVRVGPDGALYVLGDFGSSWGVHRIGRP